MSLFGLFKKRHTFTDADRELAEARRTAKLRLEMQRLEDEARVARARADREEARLKAETMQYIDVEDEGELGELIKAFMPILTRAFPQVFDKLNQPMLEAPATVQAVSDEQLQAMKAKIPPQYLKKAKKMPDDTLKAIIKSQFLPDADDNTLNRAVAIAKA